MHIAQAVVLAGSEADDRLWPSVASGPRSLVPVANRPILFHGLDGLRRAGVEEVLLAVDSVTGPAIRAAVGDGDDWRLRIRYADCAALSGVPAALPALRDFAGQRPVFIQFADTLLRNDLGTHVGRFESESLDALALRLGQSTGHAAADSLDGAWVLSARALAILAGNAVAGEDPVAAVGERGAPTDVRWVEGCRPCHGGQDSLLAGNRRVLEDISTSIAPGSISECEVQGPVVVHPTAHIERSLVRGPVVIGPGTRVMDAYIGPHTSIGADVLIEGAEIEHSIVLDGAHLRFVGARLETSVIGAGARVTRRFRTPSALRLSIGAGAEVALA